MRDSDIIMGYKCNNNCMHCVRGNNDRNMEVSFEEIIRIIDGVEKRGATRIVLQGGEPTIRKDLFDIINYVRNKKIRDIQIMSNGRMFSYSDFTKKTIESGTTDFCVSIHNCDEKKHDEFTQVKGSFEETTKGIKNLIKLKQNLKILIIITKKNYKDLSEIMGFLIDLGVKHIQIGMVAPFGNALKNFNEIVPKFSEVENYLIDALDILYENKIVFYTQDIPKCFLRDYKKHAMENYLPPSEKVYPECVILNYEKDRKNKKTKKEKCRSCKYFITCEGLYKNYLEKEGSKDNELKPVY